MSSTNSTPRRRPLIVTADPVLLDDLLRLVAAAGAEPQVAGEPGAARGAWGGAPVVLVGTDCAGAVLRRGLPRRQGLVLVGRDLDDGSVWQLAVSIGADSVAFIPDGEAALTELIAEAVDGPGAGGRTVCVVGGRGGAGASTFAAALALTAARRGHECTLIDADPLGGGLDLVLGEEGREGIRWPELAGVQGRVGSDALRRALPTAGNLSLLSWDRGSVLTVPPEAMRVALGAGRRGSDLVVVDLPRRQDFGTEQALKAGGPVLLVVPAEVRAAAAAKRVAATLAEHTHDVRVIVRGPAPAGLSADAIAALLDLPLLGYLRPESGLAGAQEHGEPPGLRPRSPLRAFCGRFLDSLDLRVAA